MKYLITGGAGFIGSYVCDRFIADGHEVVCVDNFITGSERNIAHLHSHPKFTFIEQDCSVLFHLPSVDFILHLASPASPPKYMEFPIETLLVNTVGTYYLLEHAKKHKIPLLFASTSEIYGNPQEHPQKETYWGNVNPVGPRSCYDESKRAGESYVMAYVRKYHLDGRIIRIFNTYGPRMDLDDGRVITNFISQIKQGVPLTIYGDGMQTRSFCYISDLVDAIVAVCASDRCRGEVINVGHINETTINEVAELIKKMTHFNADIVYKTLPIDDPTRRQPDIDKIKKLVGWEPKVSLEEGLFQTLKAFEIPVIV